MAKLLCSLLTLTAALALTGAAPAADNKALQLDLKDTDIAPHWIYDDLPRAFAEARATGKPIFLVLRCVPCPPGRVIDVPLMKPDPELEQLEKQFVCVRVVQCNGLDLNLFQSDLDNSWYAFFLNADKTIYGRYGTRAASRGANADDYLSLASVRKAMQRALELHRDYPANKPQLAGKVGKPAAYPVPERIPGLQDRPAKATVHNSCIHCHMVREHQLRAKWEQGKLTRDDLFVFPLPENAGLRIDVQDGLRVRSVIGGSAAEKAGIQPGDDLRTLGGQPLISMADIQWVLHTSPNQASIPATWLRDGKEMAGTLELSGNWKETDLAWRASSWLGLRYGLALQPLAPADRAKRGIGNNEMGFVVKNMWGPGGKLLQQRGLRVGDVIIGMDGKTDALTESQFLADLRLNHGPNDRVRFTILRGQQRMELPILMW
jgi:hypothetical protein